MFQPNQGGLLLPEGSTLSAGFNSGDTGKN
jgi:hypothetical protein